MLQSSPQRFRPRLIDVLRQWPWVYPRGVAPSAREWVRRAQVKAGWYAGLRRDWCEEIHAEGLADHRPPSDLPAAARPMFNDTASRRYPAAAVFHFTGASLVGAEGTVVTADNRVQAEFSHRFGTQSVSAAVYRRPFALTRLNPQRLEEPVGLLAAPQGWNYYHWLFDVLPRFKLLERWRDTITTWAVPANLSPVQQEAMRLLGLDADRLLPLQPPHRFRCQHLYVPSLPGSEGCYPPWALAFLRDTFLPLAKTTGGRGPRIYLRRGPAAQRPVLNEADLGALLEQRGFQAVTLETHSFLEQVAIFRDARMIVAAHGAGLANLAFATESGALLELYSPDYLRPDCFFTLARRRGLAYDLWLDAVAPGTRQPWGAMIADLSAISRKIDRLEDALDGKKG